MGDLSLLHRLIRVARSRPAHPMMEVWEERDGKAVRGQLLTYGEILDRVVRKSREFSRELAPGEILVGLCLPPGPEFVVSDFALMATGRTPVLIDHLLPPDTLRDLLEGFGITALVTSDPALTASLSGTGPFHLLSPALPEPDGEALDPEILLAGMLPEGENTVAHLLLTSGTTGEPKGVPLTHRNLLSDADAALSYGVFTDRDRVLSVLPLHHSYPYMTGILLPLSAGETILFPPDLSPGALSGVLERGGVTIFPAVPLLWERFHRRIMEEIDKKPPFLRSMIHRVLLPASFALRKRFGITAGALPFGAVRRRLGPRMKALFSGGAALDPKIARDFFAMGMTLLEGYGLTETSPVVSVNTPARWRVGTVGPPLPGVEVRVLPPEEGRPGGRVLVRGPIVAESWWFPGGERKALRDKDGWFDTGDLGILEDGFLTLVGREKEVIVLPNGKNIFSEPLENTLVKRAGLVEAAVLLEGKALVALLRPEISGPGTLVVLGEAVEAVNREIPPHSRIAAFEILETPLPRTRLGKLRRFLLPDIYREIRSRRLAAQPVSLVPDSPLAVRVRERIRAVAGIQGEIPDGARLEADLGIDSLGRIELLQEIEEILGAEISDELLSGIVTVGDLLGRLSEKTLGEERPADLLERPLEGSEFALIPGRGEFAGRGLSLGGRIFYHLFRGLGHLFWGMEWPRWSKAEAEDGGALRLPEGAFMVVANLSSPLDALLLALSLPPKLLSRTFVWGLPPSLQERLRPFGRLLAILPEGDQKALSGLRVALYLLRSGHGLLAFPEGEPSPDGGIRPFRPGVGALLRRSGVRVYPVRIAGTRAAWSPASLFPRPSKVGLSFGRPIDPGLLTSLDEAGIARYLEEQIRNLPGPS
ncbi:MAG: AMP-binding protein [Nitrospirae bacterium]|nr:AMP-binding protein [Nitrospirota bacterium]